MLLKPRLLIVEDDDAFAQALRRSFERRGFEVYRCEGLDTLPELLNQVDIEFAIVDLKIVGGSGLECVKLIHAQNAATRIVVLTGFASIATAVESIKLGACNYLPKPSNTDDILAAFQRELGNSSVPLSDRQTSLKSLEWERIHETLIETDFNISETARRLGMHRRTLARKLEKHRVK
ncbi:response regulator transcription factor [Elstera sp.]|jgi:two-component system response regulator RegA|uniref:response regulator transcription factor n=1 Tax=Elstera sp. TaxID=1916664 RepID=UPI0037BF7892